MKIPTKVKVMVYTKDREVYIRANRAPESLETVILALIDEYYNVKDLDKLETEIEERTAEIEAIEPDNRWHRIGE